MGLNTLIRTSKAFYEEVFFKGPKQLFEALFRKEDSTNEAAFLLDDYIQEPYAIAYRDKNNQAHIRNYNAGSGTLLEPPIASEKTIIDEELFDQITSGQEETAGFEANQMAKTERIVGDHDAGHKMTKNKQAIDVIKEGIFIAKGIDGDDLDLDENYSRAAGNSLVYDFTAGGATVDEALANICKQLDAQGTPKSGRALLLGQDWQGAIESDSAVLEKMKANTANVLISQNLNPPEWDGVEGLEFLGEYRPSKCSSSFTLLTYNPGVQYKASVGATAEPWIPDVEVAAFSFADQTWRIYRGVSVTDDSKNVVRVNGEVIFDSFTTNDPVAENLRSTTRHMFVYGNINHTAKSTGTFV